MISPNKLASLVNVKVCLNPLTAFNTFGIDIGKEYDQYNGNNLRCAYL
jgi:hypothetical protein